VLLLATGAASALPNYPADTPNGSVNSCATCHETPEGTGRNAFGTAVQGKGGPAAAWPQLFGLDSDGDGVTNGAELGDPCGVWVSGAAPERTIGITNPGVADATADPTLECGAPGGVGGGGAASSGPTGGSTPTPTPSTGAGLATERDDVPQDACAVGVAAGRDAPVAWAWAVAGALALLGARRRR
jgi:uncharacterized protein (TIGR03382 family)